MGLIVGIQVLGTMGGMTVNADEPELTRYGIDPATGGAKGVAVQGLDLIHVTQLLPLDDQGELVGPGDIDRQLDQLSINLRQAVDLAGSSMDRLVKLNVYVTTVEVADRLRARLEQLDPNAPRPAVSYVVTPLPHPEALAGLDAVVAAPSASAGEVRRVGRAASVGGRMRHAAVIMPHGNRVYISGQAEKGDGSLADATRQTLASLGRTLEFLGLEKSHVIQVKSFLTPMTGIEEVEREVEAFFGAATMPAVAVVEWESSLPIEIELVVSAAHTAKGLSPHEKIDFLTPPGMTASPIYCRVARVVGDSTIYTAGIYAKGKDLSGEAEVVSIFQQLQEILAESGSDLEHLVKATYYVANEETSNELNRLRPNYYNPERPPAASKAMIAGSGRDGVRMTIDMIATRKR
jgi:enamine deaminase RidA (YjgF/YER057c/UK114 family)